MIAAHLAEAGLVAPAHILGHPRGMRALMGGGGVSPDRLGAAMCRVGADLALAEHGF